MRSRLVVGLVGLTALTGCAASSKTAAKDVTVTACKPSPTGGHPTAAGHIVNHSSKASVYTIHVKFADSAGNGVGDGLAAVARVEAGRDSHLARDGNAQRKGRCQVHALAGDPERLAVARFPRMVLTAARREEHRGDRRARGRRPLVGSRSRRPPRTRSVAPRGRRGRAGSTRASPSDSWPRRRLPLAGRLLCDVGAGTGVASQAALAGRRASWRPTSRRECSPSTGPAGRRPLPPTPPASRFRTTRSARSSPPTATTTSTIRSRAARGASRSPRPAVRCSHRRTPKTTTIR